MPTCWLAPQPALLSMFSCTPWMSSRQEPRPCPTLASRCAAHMLSGLCAEQHQLLPFNGPHSHEGCLRTWSACLAELGGHGSYS